MVIETHAIDDRLGLGQAKYPWLGVAWLRARRHGSHFDETEAQLRHSANGFAVLVQPCCQADRIGEIEPHHLNRKTCWRFAEHCIEPETATGANQLEGKFMGSFRR